MKVTEERDSMKKELEKVAEERDSKNETRESNSQRNETL